MQRLEHGASLAAGSQAVPGRPPVDLPITSCPPRTAFGFLFPDLQPSPSNLLPEGPATARDLISLGQTMFADKAGVVESDSAIPSVYTYFGQFITHDLALEITTKSKALDRNVQPLKLQEIGSLRNAHSGLLNLDSVYGPILDGPNCYEVQSNGDELAVDAAINSQDLGTDVPRDLDPPYAARIGDRRNDENLITSQLHLAFLRAHNAIVRDGSTFADAQRILRRHFQWLILFDFLPRVIDPSVFQLVLDGSIDVFKGATKAFMPLEFVGAAFRYGHSMSREIYNYNNNFKTARLYNIFLPQDPRYHHILKEWIIDWERFVGTTFNVARRIDTNLVDPMSELVDPGGKPMPFSIAALDLLRGYFLRLPTGQAVASALNLPVMSANELEGVAEEINPQQKLVLKASGFSERTPLWFYILAEAAFFKNGRCLGPVGSTIVAGVLISIIRRSTDSILQVKNWRPILGSAGQFDIATLFRLAGVLK